MIEYNWINIERHTCEKRCGSGINSWCVFNTLWDSWGPWWWWEKLVRDHYRCTHESPCQVWLADTCKIFLYSRLNISPRSLTLVWFLFGCQLKIGRMVIVDCIYLLLIVIINQYNKFQLFQKFSSPSQSGKDRINWSGSIDNIWYRNVPPILMIVSKRLFLSDIAIDIGSSR